ncbi:hypothetical protein EON64_04490 [archaeon]|nr:MAG: hypothetical protein EON64_04490 [archaeon]
MSARTPRAATKKKLYAEGSEAGSDGSSDFGGGSPSSEDGDDSLSPDSADEPPKKKGKSDPKSTPSKKSPAKKEPSKKSTATKPAAAKSPGTNAKPAATKSSAVASSSTGGAAKASSLGAASSVASSALGGTVDITQGGAVTTDAAAKKLLLQYMTQQNRPYSALQVFDNLHRRIPKATLERVLGVLCGPGEGLVAKEYGKTKIYYVDQTTLTSDFSAEQLQDLMDENDELKRSAEALGARDKELRGDLQRLQAEPEDSQLDTLLADEQARVVSKQERLGQLQSQAGGAVRGNEGALKRAIERHNKARQEWVTRRAMCLDALDLLAESMDKKKSVIMVSNCDALSLVSLVHSCCCVWHADGPRYRG